MARCLVFLVSLTMLTTDAAVAARKSGRRLRTVGRNNLPGDSYSQNCSVFPGRRVVLMTVNIEYLDMFQNWLHHAKQFLTETEQVVAVAEDWEAGLALHNLSTSLTPHLFVVDGFDPEHQTQKTIGTPSVYGNAVFTNLVQRRPTRILSFLRESCSVLYVDIDTVWKRSPFPDMAALGTHDLYVTDDAVPSNGITGHPSWNLCSCFIYVNPTPGTIAFVQRWSDLMQMPEDPVNADIIQRWQKVANLEPGIVKMDQPNFNFALHEDYNTSRTVDIGLLPCDRFPNGFRAKDHNDATIYHANWRVGHESKVSFFQQMDLWKPETS